MIVIMEILKIISLVFAVILAIYTWNSFKKGTMLNIPSVVTIPKLRFNRAENPVYFWMAIISYICMILLLVLFGLGLV